MLCEQGFGHLSVNECV